MDHFEEQPNMLDNSTSDLPKEPPHIQGEKEKETGKKSPRITEKLATKNLPRNLERNPITGSGIGNDGCGVHRPTRRYNEFEGLQSREKTNLRVFGEPSK